MPHDSTPDPAPNSTADQTAESASRLDRRAAVRLGALGLLGFIGGCASSNTADIDLPQALFPQGPILTRDPSPRVAAARPAPSPAAPTTASSMPGVIQRSSWAGGPPVHARMNPMKPPAWITIHHDGMKPFRDTSAASSRERLELIRRAHLNRDGGWGDIGYHYVVDRGGRVWEGRSLSYQGAHVGQHNEGNIGIMCMGNFNAQSPSDAQLNAMLAHVRAVQQRYRIDSSRVRTHREWPSARTACPGSSLQTSFDSMRAQRRFA